jgi:gliding motility-associated-like protein
VKKLLYIVTLLLLKFQGFSYHLVGGEMIYDDLGNGNYRITLKIYRDCAASNASNFDGLPGTPTAYLTVYDASNAFQNLYDLGAPVISEVPPAFNNPCIQVPDIVCIEEGVYTYTLNLPPKNGGYTLVYQRCCRNSIIENLLFPDGQGVTYFTQIPGPEKATVNNSPYFSKFPPIYICNNVPFKFDHSASDPDGDQLVYSLCAPYMGLDGCCPSLYTYPPQTGSTCVSPPFSCPTAAPQPPYSNVSFLAPYSGAYPIASNPAFSIHPTSGELSGTPTLTGQYVVGVCVQEFRNNQLLNTHFRDFQFTVIGCTVSALSAVADQKQQCQGNVISFNNQSINNSPNPFYHWDFGVATLSNDTSNLFNPSYQYPDTGIYTITLITNPGKPCTDTLKKEVYVYPPLKVYFDRPDKQCLINNSFHFTTKGDYNQQTTYFWDFGSLASPDSATIKDPSGISFTESGLFFVKLKAKQFACRDSFMDSVRVIPRPKARINNIQNGVCELTPVGFSNGSSSELPLRYYWDFGNGKTSTAYEPNTVYTAAGNYTATLIVETTEICNDTSVAQLMNIVVHASPQAAFSVVPKETSLADPYVHISGFAEESVHTTTFSFGDGQGSTQFENVHSYADIGTYTITQILENQYGCLDTLSSLVKILPDFYFWIPNSFTPDGNGLNDVFMPLTLGTLNYEFEIYNRWGARIFRTENTKEGWNGSFKNEACEQGVYTWRITYKNILTGRSEQRIGNVNLFRNP